jgi:hypothetical protein
MRNQYSRLQAAGRCGALALFALLGANTAFAQTLGIPALGAQSLAGTYTDLGSSGTAIATANFDDASSAAQNIGFSFTFGGSTFTQFVLNTNGYVKLGTTAPPAPNYSNSPFSVVGGALKGAGTYLLVPFNTDLEAAASGGTENRVCTIQWKNVSDKTRPGVSNTIDKQLASFSFQLKLYEGTNQVEFVYGSAVAASPTSIFYSVANVGLKGAGSGPVQVLSVLKGGGTAWSTPTFQDGVYDDYSTGFSFTSLTAAGGATALPDAGRTYRFSPPVANDLAVRTVYSVSALPAGQAYAYRAYITNPGSTSVSGQTATLTLTGANLQTATVAIPTLAAGATATVRFPGLLLAQAGTTTATVSVPADGNNTNNAQSAPTTTTTGSGYFSVISSAAPASSTTFIPNTTNVYTSAFAVKYRATTPYTINVVRARIGDAADNAGNVVYGVVADTTGQILAQSAPYTLQAGDNNTLHTFVLTTPVQVPAGSFLAGMAQVVQPTTFFAPYPSPMAYQTEVPTRPGTFYQFGISTPSTPADITTTGTPNYRYLIEAGFNTLLTAAKDPELAGTLSVYPNPSATGQLTLDVRGAGPGLLTVQVLNTLGQRVYTGAARSEAATFLNLSGLATGIYYLQVRSGTAASVRKVVMTR